MTATLKLASSELRRATHREIARVRAMKALGEFAEFPEAMTNIQNYRKSHSFYVRCGRLMA